GAHDGLEFLRIHGGSLWSGKRDGGNGVRALEAQVTGAGLNSTSALCNFQCSAQVFLRPLATSSIRWNISQPTSAMVFSPVAIVPALTSIRSCQRRGGGGRGAGA